MQNLLDELLKALETDKRLVIDGKLAKNKIIELALNLDETLLKLLLKNDAIKKHFFREVGTTLIFDKIEFQKFVSNKQFLPDSYTTFRNKIGLTANGEYLSEADEVVLVWPYKDCVLEGDQTKGEQKRKELFWNETLAPDEIDRLLSPKILTNFKRYDSTGEHKVDTISMSDNLVIKGNNLLALTSIIKVYAGKVQFIYIDPPYNTGNDDFNYNDSFNHSTWLTFMSNRLELAKKLLCNNGIIVIHCDFIEDNYLKVATDEIFGRENFINSIAIRDSHPSGLKLSARDTTIIKTKSTMLVYKKGDTITINPVYQRRYEWDKHFNTFIDTDDDTKQKKRIPLADYIIDNKIILDQNFVLNEQALMNKIFKEFAFKNRHKIFQSTKEIPTEAREKSLENNGIVIEYSKGEYALNGRRLSPLSKSIYNIGFDGFNEEDFGKLLCDFWDDVDFNNSQNEGGVSFPSGKKPELLLARLISMFTKKTDLVCDFFLGSGTTDAVAHKMGRQYIGIEQLNYGANDSIVRLRNVINSEQSGISKLINWKGGGSFISCELKKNNAEFSDKIEASKTNKELFEIWEQLQNKGFISFKVQPIQINENKAKFDELDMDEKKRFLIEILDKNQLYVNYSEIEDKDYTISDEDKILNHLFYGLK